MARKRGNIKWNKEGFRKLRLEPRIQDRLHELAIDVANEAASLGTGSGDGVRVFEEGVATDDDSGYQVTDLVLEESRGAVSVMAVGEGHYHNRKYMALLQGVSRVARQNG